MVMIPKTPFSTPLSASAKETKRRIRNLFQEKKRPPWPILALGVTVILLCGSLVSCRVQAEQGEFPREIAAALSAVKLSVEPAQQPEPGSSGVTDPLSRLTLKNGLISMQGWSGSPEYMAIAEWMDFLDQYDSDGSILNAASQGQIAIPAGYSAYTCYSQEMADQLDALCGKYGLSLLSAAVACDDGAALLAQAGVENVCGGAREGAENTPYGGCCYRDGSLHFDGACVLPGESGEMYYQFCRAVKGSLNTSYRYIGSAEQYQQWEYTTQNGVPLLLALGGGKAVLIADTDSSFVVVNILPYDGQVLSRETVEAFAETFDFSTV